MASTFSTTLRLELIGDGDQSGIWGQTTNTNLGSLIEQAITGVVSITMTDTNYTLSNFNGVSDEARNAVLVVGGTNAAVRDIIAPLVEKLYIVKNSTSGGFAINIRGSSGTSVSVPNGVTTSVYCDGTNFNSGLSGTSGSFNINGALTYGGVTLANAVTGTGNMALSASPTFTGTPAAPTASPGTNTTQIATTAFALANGIPSGAIILWSGAIGSIPSGWLLCNGTSGTPDLRDRFIVGAGSTYAVAATGGATTATLGTTNLPSHTHSISASGTTSGQSATHVHSYSGTTGGMDANNPHNHTATDSGHTHTVPSGASGASTPTGPAPAASINGQTTATGNANISVSTTDIAHGHTYSGNTAANSVDHNHTVTVSGTSGATGSGTAFSILPPYYALAYIMKA